MPLDLCYSQFSSVQSLSRVPLFVTPWTAARQAFLSFTIFQSLFKLMSIESVMSPNHLILCHLLLPPFFNLSQHQGLFQFFASGGQSIGASPLASILPMNSQGWFPLGWTGLISLQSKGLPRVFSRTRVWRHQFFGISTCFGDLFSPSSFSCVASAAAHPILFITVTFLPKDPIWTLYPWSQ